MLASALATVFLLLDAHDRQLFDLARAYELRTESADALLKGKESLSSAWFRLASKETAKTWYVNSVRLLERFNGDPRRLFSCTSDARTLMKEIRSFRGYGPKIGGMLLRASIGLGFANVSGIEEVLVPVDIHDARISVYTGIIITESEIQRINYYSYVKQVQKILLDTCNKLGTQWLNADRALWLIGSRGCVTKRCTLCPLNDICSVGITVLNGIKV